MADPLVFIENAAGLRWMVRKSNFHKLYEEAKYWITGVAGDAEGQQEIAPEPAPTVDDGPHLAAAPEAESTPGDAPGSPETSEPAQPEAEPVAQPELPPAPAEAEAAAPEAPTQV